MAEETQTPDPSNMIVEPHPHPEPHDEVVLPFLNRRFTVYGGIYTFIFGVLAVLTLIETALTFIPENAFIVTILVVLSLIKAYLVCMYYMHLKDDNPLYRFTLIIPLIIVILSVAYLIFVPRLGGLGYF
jgi:caa(3)-type oxidase subunit IV